MNTSPTEKDDASAKTKRVTNASVQHPLYSAAATATHSRPALPVDAASIVDHAVILVGEASPGEDQARFLDLMEREGWVTGQKSFGEIIATRGEQTVKWERHTEFIALTHIAPNSTAHDVLTLAFNALIVPLCEGLDPGRDGEAEGLFSRTRIVLEVTDTLDAAVDPLQFQEPLLQVMTNGDAVRLITDLRHNDEGIIVYVARLSPTVLKIASPRRLGRFVQRLIEIDSYRLLSYLAVPMMQKLGPRVSHLEAKVNAIAMRTAGEPKPEEEEAILTELTNLSAELQSIGSASEFRFAASLAYSAIVNERLEAIRESRIEGYQRLSNAVNRRLDPAMRSSEALLARQQKIADRIGRVTELLRTRVDLTLQDQNSAVLRSIDARADAQLKLQKTVEGLSVAAITYYILGILGYLIKGAPWESFGYSSTIVQAFIVIPVILLIFLGVRRVRMEADAELPPPAQD